MKAGNIRYLTFYSDRRYSDPSGVPVQLELGFPEAAKLPTLVGLYAHKNTPKKLRKFFIMLLKRRMNDPEFKKGFEKFGEEPRFGGPEFLKRQLKNLKRLVSRF